MIRFGPTLRLLFLLVLLPLCTVGSFCLGWQDGYASGRSEFTVTLKELTDEVIDLHFELNDRDKQIKDLSDRIAVLEKN